MTNLEAEKIGEVTHYFGDINVAIIKVSTLLKIGDEIKIVGGDDTDFTQQIKAMEIDHEEVEEVEPGQEVGIKVKEKVRDGYEVYRP